MWIQRLVWVVSLRIQGLVWVVSLWIQGLVWVVSLWIQRLVWVVSLRILVGVGCFLGDTAVGFLGRLWSEFCFYMVQPLCIVVFSFSEAKSMYF